MSSPISTYGFIGIVGGGQLGRMMAIAAAEMGYRTHVFTPEQESPASEVATLTTVASYTDIEALTTFAKSVEVVTFEFENIPHASLEALEAHVPVRPSPAILELTQHRGREKSFVNELGIGTAPFRLIASAEELEAAAKEIGLPAVLKTTMFGYDGKGQVMLKEGADLAQAWHSLRTKEAILEGFVDFRMEISVIVARDVAGNCAAYVPVQNEHKHHILDRTTAPAPISPALAEKAEEVARRIAISLDLVGLLAVEMFVTKTDDILVNELAPRPHNSGHWTIDACAVSQFTQSIRAAAGLPLGSTERLCDAVMQNLIGDDVNRWQDFLQDKRAKIHLYGKKEIRRGRKMGHATTLIPLATPVSARPKPSKKPRKPA